MKIYLDKDYLQKITKGNHEFIVWGNQITEMERIRGMLMHDIRFCGLITGYRGTGKSTYIKWIMNDLEKKDDMIVISFNAAKYNNYDVFLKRFIRELYFKLNEKNRVSEQLEKMYFHTFFDIKETYFNNSNMLETVISGDERQTQLQVKNNVNIMNVIKVVLSILLVLVVESCTNSIVIKTLVGIIVFITTIGELVDVNLLKDSFFKKWSGINKEQAESSEHTKSAETLYDNEIAEYYVYDEIRKIGEKLNLVVVLDELDKVEDEALDKIFRELKPLLLSENCNFILIAGRNMEKYLKIKQQDVDSIVTTVFSNKIYMSLSGVQEMKEFAIHFLEGDDYFSKWRTFDLDENIQIYLKVKIFEAKGVKRAFLNKILSDLRWDVEKSAPYIEGDEKLSKEVTILFDVLEKMEEYIDQNYSKNEKRDELLQNVYYWIEKIQEKRYTLFLIEDIVDEESQLGEIVFFSNIPEQMNLVYTLLDYMIEKGILEITENGYHKWCSDILINTDFDEVNMEKDENKDVIKEYIEVFLMQWDEVDKLLSFFAEYNCLKMSNEVSYLRFREILDTMISDFNKKDSDLGNALGYLEKLYKNGISMEDIDDIKKCSTGLGVKKGVLLEKLIEYTYRNKFKIVDLKVGGVRNPMDAVYLEATSNRTIFMEIKYYKEYLKLVNRALLYKLMGMVISYVKNNRIKDYLVKLLVFTDVVDEEEITRFEEKCDEMLDGIYEKEKIQIFLIPFSDYNLFKKQMDNLIK